MPPLLFPSEPDFVNVHERHVWDALRDQLGDRDLLIANRPFVDTRRDYEVDLIVVLDGAGVVIIEVKGGTVGWENGDWWQASVDGRRRIDPVGQAVNNKYVVKDWVEASPVWGARHPVRWAHAVAFPSVSIAAGFTSPDLTRSMVIDKDDLADIASKVRNLPLTQTSNNRLLDFGDTEAIVEALSARLAPTPEQFTTVQAQAEDMENHVERLSQEQATILNALELLDRVHVMGGAGSGKTWLALEKARRSAKDGLRVAVVSYSRGLSVWMRRRVGNFARKEQPAYVGTFHELGEQWGVHVDDTSKDSHYWENELPAAIAEAASRQAEGQRFDVLIIDEAQDFAGSWWTAALAVLAHDDSHLYVFSDIGQRVFERDGETPEGLVPIQLTQNIRNTKQISQTFNSLGDSTLRASTYEGLPVRWIEADHTEAVDRADGAIDGLLDEGWKPSDIALLTTGRRHPEHENRIGDQTNEEYDEYWASFWDEEQVFFGHVSGFKGLDRPVVVLAINEQPGRDKALERLYVGLSRARDLLVVVGSAEHIEAVGGPAVLRKIRGE